MHGTQRHINTLQYDVWYTQRHINTLQYDARYTKRHTNYVGLLKMYVILPFKNFRSGAMMSRPQL